MSNLYLPQIAPAIGGGLPGQPQRAQMGYNEVIAVASFQIPAGASTTTDFEIPFRFESAAELDLVIRRTPVQTGPSSCVLLSGSPLGLGGRLTTTTDSSSYVDFVLVGNAIRVTTASFSSHQGRFEILRRNRRVKQFQVLAASTVVAALNFTIGNPYRAILSTRYAEPNANSHSPIYAYYPASETDSWHINGRESTSQTSVKIVSPSTYMTRGGVGNTFVLTEYE